MRINHNISAQVANLNLRKADNRMTASLQRLSSGYKINKAADDSAGIAVSNKMRTQIRALEQASRNADDGVSVIQTAEGALTEIENMLQRCRELSVQASNDTYTIDDRESVQREMEALLEEIDRIADTTEFNGNKLINGSCSRVVTCNAIGVENYSVSESVPAGKDYQIRVDEIDKPAKTSVSVPSFPGPSETIMINGVAIDISPSSYEDDASYKSAVAEDIRTACDKMGIDAVPGPSGTLFSLTTRATGYNQQITINDNEPVRGSDAKVTAIPTDDGFGGTETVVCNGGHVTISDRTGFEMKFGLDTNYDEPAKGKISNGERRILSVYDTGAMKLQIGANEGQYLAVDFSEISCRTLGLKEVDGDYSINVCSAAAATNAIESFDRAIRDISSYRSRLGAFENRLESTTASLDITSENITNSMSRIMDTDMAEAMTEYTQEDVLSQAATSILAQANNRPQRVMSLLQS